MSTGNTSYHTNKAIGIWLIFGVVLIFVQVMLGGITRLTGSGLSITEWELVLGAIPPMNYNQWMEAFEKYRQFPQYELVNKGMSLEEFKWIYFWEYFHRLWGRMLGFVFLVPLIYFVAKKQIPLQKTPRYLLLLVLGGAQGAMGWIMVKSGLVDMPWVSPTKLTAHLLLAAALYILTFRLALANLLGKQVQFHSKVVRGSMMTLMWLILFQIALGGMVAGWKAAIPYPTWPKMNGAWVPDNMFTLQPWWLNWLENKALLHFAHRMLGYFIFVYVVSMFLKMSTIPKGAIFHRARWTLLALVTIQLILGILTVVNSIGSVPVGYGVLHQAGAFLLLLNLVYLHYVYKYR